MAYSPWSRKSRTQLNDKTTGREMWKHTPIHTHDYRFVCIFIHTHTCTWVCKYVRVCVPIPPTRGSQITPQVGRELEHKISAFCFSCPEVCNLLKTLPEAAISRTEEQIFLFYKKYTENVFTKVLISQ